MMVVHQRLPAADSTLRLHASLPRQGTAGALYTELVACLRAGGATSARASCTPATA